MELIDAIKGRRSIRHFEDRPVSDVEIERLVDLARHAPSSMNGQPWHFIVVRSQRTKDALAAIKNAFCPPEKQAYPADFMRTAPVIIVVGVETARSYGRDVENSVFAVAPIMWGACAAGLSCVYMSAYMSAEPGLADGIRRELSIPNTVEPISIIPVGYPAAPAERRTLRPLREILHAERFGSP